MMGEVTKFLEDLKTLINQGNHQACNKKLRDIKNDKIRTVYLIMNPLTITNRQIMNLYNRLLNRFSAYTESDGPLSEVEKRVALNVVNELTVEINTQKTNLQNGLSLIEN